MGLYLWLLGFGMPGAIAKDLIRKYEKVKISLPDSSEEEVLDAVWGLWLALNMPNIESGNDTNKKIRLEIMMEEVDKDQSKKYYNNLLEYFNIILYIETGVLRTEDTKTYMKCLKVFVKECKKRSINFEEELAHIEWLMRSLSKL